MQVKKSKKSFLRSKALSVANTIRHIVGFSDALRIGYEIAHLINDLKKGESTFQYLKKSDLSQRIAVGTLNPELLPLPKSGKTEKKKNHAYVCYYDTQKKGFRSFHVLNFNGVSKDAPIVSLTQSKAA